jgi:hypothetical protein
VTKTSRGTNSQHWIVVKGYIGNSFVINDPIKPDPLPGVQPNTLETFGYSPVLKESVRTYTTTPTDLPPKN